jgi:hypothetical protein
MFCSEPLHLSALRFSEISLLKNTEMYFHTGPTGAAIWEITDSSNSENTFFVLLYLKLKNPGGGLRHLIDGKYDEY